MDTFETLIELLKSADEDERTRAAIGLVRMDDVRVIPPLQRMAESDESAQVRYLARKGLKVIKDRALFMSGQTAAPLPADDPEGQLKQVETLVASASADERRMGVSLACHLDNPDLFPVLKTAYEREDEPAVKSEMIQGLTISGGKKAYPLIKKALKSKEHRLRANAVEAASLTGDDTLIKSLVPLLQDADHRVAANAAMALKEHSPAIVLDRLKTMLGARSVATRDAAAYALAHLDNEMAIPLLVRASRDKKKTVRLKAITGLEALAGGGSEEAHDVLKKIFTDDEEGLTDYFSLADEKPKVPGLDSADFKVRLAAVKDIIKAGDKSALPALKAVLPGEPDSYVKSAIIRGIGELGKAGDKPAVERFLHDKDHRVRANAVYACYEIASDATVGLLGSMAGDEDLRVSEKAVSSLGMLKGDGNEAASSVLETLDLKRSDLTVNDSFVAFDDGSIIQLAPSEAEPVGTRSVLSSLRSTRGLQAADVSLRQTQQAAEPDSAEPPGEPGGAAGTPTLSGRPHLREQEEKYVIAGEIGRGGMGIILNAMDTDIRREVAMKVMAGGASSTSQALERFIEEVQVQGQLEHPHICPVHELGTDAEGKVYFTMKMVKGASLAETIKEEMEQPEPIDARHMTELLGMFMKICDGIAYAHSKGVIHRDLKPGNIMVGDFGEVYVMDWGLAKIVGRDDSRREALVITDRGEDGETMKTMSGAVVGTPAYMPPEQARGLVEEMDRRSDIYSLGALLYELLTLEPPFTGSNPWNILEKVCTSHPELPSERNPWRNIPSELDSIVMKCMAPRPEDRYRTVQELKEEIELFLSGRPIGAMEYSLWQVFVKWVARNKALSAAAAAVLLVIVISFSVSYVQISRQKKVAEEERDKAQRAEQEAVLARTDAERQRTIAEENEKDARSKLVDSLVSRGQLNVESLEVSKAAAVFEEVKSMVTEGQLDIYPYIDLRLWKVKQGGRGYYEVVSSIEAHQGEVTSLGFTPDGGRLISSGRDNTVVFWDMETFEPVRRFPEPDSGYSYEARRHCLGFTPDGRLAGIKTGKKEFGIWNLETGDVTGVGEHPKEVTSVAINLDGTMLATGGRDRTVRLWDVESRQEIRVMWGLIGNVADMFFNRDDSYLIASDDRRIIMVWEVMTGNRVGKFWDHRFDVTDMDLSPDSGDWLLTGSSDTSLRLFQWLDPDYKEEMGEFWGHGDAVKAVAFNPKGKKNVIFSGSRDGTVRLWDTVNRVPISILRGHDTEILRLAVSPDGQVLVTGGADGVIKLWRRGDANDLVTIVSRIPAITRVALSPDGTRVAYAVREDEYTCHAMLADAETGRNIGPLMDEFWGFLGIAYAPDGRYIATGGKDDLVQIWDVAANELYATFEEHGADVNMVDFSPDGTLLASASDDRFIRVWDVAAKKCALSIGPCRQRVWAVKFAPDGSSLYGGTHNGWIGRWNVKTGELIHEFRAHDSMDYCLNLSADGAMLASSGRGSEAMVWRAGTGECLGILQGHLGEVRSVAFSPDGRLLATGSMDNTIKLWDLNQLKKAIGEDSDGKNGLESVPAAPVLAPIITFPGHWARVESLQFNKDGRTLVSGSFDGTVKIWHFGDAIRPRTKE